MVNIRIVSKDSGDVTKVVILDKHDRILFLKRTEYSKKHAGEWDLPGGHIKKNESPMEGLKREVLEETGIKLETAIPFKKENKKNKKDEFLHFFYSIYSEFPNKLDISEEHNAVKFFTKKELNKSDKFQSIALDVLKRLKK